MTISLMVSFDTQILFLISIMNYSCHLQPIICKMCGVDIPAKCGVVNLIIYSCMLYIFSKLTIKACNHFLKVNCKSRCMRSQYSLVEYLRTQFYC